MRHPILTSLLAALCASALGSAASAATAHWANLHSVTVIVANGTLPPPYSQPKSKRFHTASQLRKVTAALNSHHIAKRRSVASTGCTGGYDVTIAISPAHGRTMRLKAYRCGGRTYGGIAGDVPDFLTAVGFKAV